MIQSKYAPDTLTLEVINLMVNTGLAVAVLLSMSKNRQDRPKPLY